MQTDERERDDTNVDYLDAHAGLWESWCYRYSFEPTSK